MNSRGNFNIGDEIRNIVQDAVNNRDFNRLNRDIGDAVNGALDEVRKSFDKNRNGQQTWNNNASGKPWWKVSDTQGNQEDASRSQNNSQGQSGRQGQQGSQGQQGGQYNSASWNTRANDRNQSRQSYRQANRDNNYYQQRYTQNKPMVKPNRFTVPVGQVSGILFTVFGAIGSSGFGVATAVLAIIGFVTSSTVLFNIAAGLLPCFLISMILSMNGGRIRKRLKRYQRYVAQLQGRNYSLIKEFSSATGRSEKYTIKDIQNMIAIGMFPDGHIDDKKTCFMLNRESYDMYLKLQENMRMKEMEEQASKKEQATSQQTQQDTKNQKDTLDPATRKAVEDGRQFVQEIRKANLAIPGEEISRKLDRLEAVTGKIYDYIELHPDKLSAIKKFTEYFLPTTLKLLDAYRELDYQPVVGENISTAKKEIEDTLDTINTAFENLLDGLFEEAAMDISTDISVLHTMFAQEGLTEKNLKQSK